MPVLSNAAARRLFLSRHLLADTPKTDLAGVIDALGFVQLDSVNTLARAHDLTLWARRPAYRPAALNHLLAHDRGVFEHWTHDASVIPIAHFPHWRHRFARDGGRLIERWKAWHAHEFEDRFEGVLKRISDHGECTSGELAAGEVRGKTGWWDWHPSKTALEYLWRTGQISVVRRDGFRKVYDLTERVIPAQHLNARNHPAETVDWACDAAMDRLGFATSGELAAFWALVTPEEAKAWCAAALAGGRVTLIDVEGADGALRRCYVRPDLMDIVVPSPVNRVRLLSPFDPALRDRNRAERLFGFHYRIEIFVPEALRKYGYYVFPVLEGTTLIGRIDVRAERSGVGSNPPYLSVKAFWPEPGVGFGKGRQGRLLTELDRVARFAGCERVQVAEGWVKGQGRDSLLNG